MSNPRRCTHEVTRDILSLLRDIDEGEGVPPTRLFMGPTGGMLNSRTIKPWLARLCKAGLIEELPKVTKRTRRYKLLPKGARWLLRFNQLEEMVGGGE